MISKNILKMLYRSRLQGLTSVRQAAIYIRLYFQTHEPKRLFDVCNFENELHK
jgi:hypothetical protein